MNDSPIPCALVWSTLSQSICGFGVRVELTVLVTSLYKFLQSKISWYFPLSLLLCFCFPLSEPLLFIFDCCLSSSSVKASELQGRCRWWICTEGLKSPQCDWTRAQNSSQGGSQHQRALPEYSLAGVTTGLRFKSHPFPRALVYCHAVDSFFEDIALVFHISRTNKPPSLLHRNDSKC